MMERFLKYLAERWWRTAAVLTAGVGIGYVALAVIPDVSVPPDADHPDGTAGSNWAIALFLVSAAVVVLGLFAIGRWYESRYWKDSDRRAARIHKLTDSLDEAMHDIAAIQREVTRGTELLQRLEADAAMKAQLAALSDEESAAVRGFLESAVRRETNRGSWLNVLVATLFFVLGVVAANVF